MSMMVTSCPRQIRTSGGLRDTEVNELTVRPWGTPCPSSTLAIVTPEAKRPQARRNSSLVTGAMRPEGPSLDMSINSILSYG
jgi:hypothetical protein